MCIVIVGLLVWVGGELNAFFEACQISVEAINIIITFTKE